MFVYIRMTAFVIVVTQKLVLQQSKNVTAKCTENLSPSPCILFSLLLKYALLKKENTERSVKEKGVIGIRMDEVYGRYQIKIENKEEKLGWE